MKVKNLKGFTLAELLIVMAIIVVLAAVAIPSFSRQLETSRETTDMENIRNAYTEAMSIAILDFADGKLDGKKDGTAISNDTGYTVSGGGLANKASIVAAIDPITQKGGWDYVNNKVAGRTVQAADNGDTTVTFLFVVNSGNLELEADTGATKPIVVSE